MATKKSDILNKLSDNYPNFLKKDLVKIIDIFLYEIKSSLKRRERVELRDVFSLEQKLSKVKLRRDPKTNKKIFVEEKYSINFKSSKYWSKKINEKK